MILLIIAAGNGTRLGTTIPKALMSINGVPNLINTLSKVNGLYDFVHIVINSNHYNHFAQALNTYKSDYDLPDVNLIELTSANGSGQAVYEAMINLSELDLLPNYITIMWGDTYLISNDIIIESQKYYTSYDSKMLIPVKIENKPYLSLEFDSNGFCSKADFSQPDIGYHDQSIFIIKKSILDDFKVIHNVLWDTDHYTSDVGEFNFMNIIQYLHNINTPAQCYISNFKTLSYNTLHELHEIEKEVS